MLTGLDLPSISLQPSTPPAAPSSAQTIAPPASTSAPTTTSAPATTSAPKPSAPAARNPRPQAPSTQVPPASTSDISEDNAEEHAPTHPLTSAAEAPTTKKRPRKKQPLRLSAIQEASAASTDNGPAPDPTTSTSSRNVAPSGTSKKRKVCWQ